MGDLWVFGYGSLMWNPGFTFAEQSLATLTGYRRRFCVYSVHHRGSATRPGLVLGLDRGGVCRGVAFRVPQDCARATIAYLRAREQVNGVYREAHVPVELAHDRGSVLAVAFLAERAHPSFTGPLSIARQARLIRAARGLSGSNLAYLVNTLDHLTTLGLRERELERVLVLTGSCFARGASEADRAARAMGLARLSQHLGVGSPVMGICDRKRFGHRQS
jgi:glutathione-specific gamma-glutamylcyclotransferase